MILPVHPVERALAASRHLPRDGVVLVAVSGGADSMALVEGLRCDPARGSLVIVVAHFDHRLRDESARDAEHVAAYARAHGFGFVADSEDVAGRARARRRSIEESAREARYEFLTAAAARVGADWVATAHTRSDQVETILMRILRGAGRVGISGIPERRGLFVRPLLGVTRAQTRDYCVSRGIAFVDDPSNQDLRFHRNRVRHEILPSLRASFPDIDQALLRIAHRARREQDAFAARTEGWIRTNVREEAPGVWTVPLTAFEGTDDEDASALLRDAVVRAGLARDVGRVHYARLLGLVRSDHAGPSADVPGFSARREHDALVLTRHAAGGAKAVRPKTRDGGATATAAVLAIPGRTRVGDWVVDAELVSPDEARVALARREDDVAYFDATALALPLRARAPRPGDAMRPLGLGGHKKLSDLFIDRKIPRRARARAIVIEGESIHWVPGLATSELGRVGDATRRVLRLAARPTGSRS